MRPQENSPWAWVKGFHIDRAIPELLQTADKRLHAFLDAPLPPPTLFMELTDDEDRDVARFKERREKVLAEHAALEAQRQERLA